MGSLESVSVNYHRVNNNWNFEYDNDKQLETKNDTLFEFNDSDFVENTGNSNTKNKEIEEADINVSLLGSGKYEADGKRRAEDTENMDKTVLSKEAKTLSENEQKAYLTKSGININEYTACKAEDGSVCFKSKDGTKFFRVVNHNGANKMICTIMNGNKASFNVYSVKTTQKDDIGKTKKNLAETQKEKEAEDKARKIQKEAEEKAEETRKQAEQIKKEAELKAEEMKKEAEKIKQEAQAKAEEIKKEAEKLKQEMEAKAAENNKSGKDKKELPETDKASKINAEKCADDLFAAMDGFGTNEPVLESILFDEGISDNDFALIVKKYEEKYGADKGELGLISRIDDDTSGELLKKLSVQLSKRLVNAAENGDEEALIMLCKEIHSASIGQSGTVDDFLTAVFNDLKDETVVKINKKYSEVYEGKNLADDIKSEYTGLFGWRSWLPGKHELEGNGEAILDKINKALRHAG